MRCSFNLNKTEYNLLIFLLRESKQRMVSQISKATRLERTTIQKAIKTLVEKRLVNRRQKNLPKGGYIFLYEPSDKEEIKNRMKEVARRWYKNVEASIDKL